MIEHPIPGPRHPWLLRSTLRRACATLALLCGTAGPALADWQVQQLDQLSTTFANTMSNGYTVSSYGWKFFQCTGDHCYGVNPDTTYGYPLFDPLSDAPVQARNMRSQGAMVLLMETPPSMRYFGVTPYLFAKYYQRLPGRPDKSGWVEVFESMTDSVNALNMKTTGSPTPGRDVNTQLSAFVVTADATTFADVSARLVSIGFPATAINLIDLPISVPGNPLNMGVGTYNDTYTVILRLNYPDQGDQLIDYINRAPARVHYIEPAPWRTNNPVPPTVYKTPGNGQPEPAILKVARDQLADQLVANAKPQFSSITEMSVYPSETTNYACARVAAPCHSDSPDAVYTADLGLSKPFAPGPDDRVLVVGVLHSAGPLGTGKVTYLSQAVMRPDISNGVLAVPDNRLEGTGLRAAGITDPSDPRYATYSRLYAVSFSYNCPPGDPICVTIPASGTGGVPPGTPLEFMGRMYLDPATTTRPNRKELILERSFVMQK